MAEMSELNEYYYYEDRVVTPATHLYRVYHADEADKVIAELKDKLQNVSSLLKETREWLLESQKLHKRCADNASKVIRHHKYKRCLNKAEWCEERCARYDLLQEHSGFSWRREIDFYFRWYQRWLELAEKFKEAK